MFEGYRLNGPALSYPVFFAVRRYGIILVLTLLRDYPYLQIFSHMIITGLAIDYLWAFNPYTNKAITRQEIINETVVLLATYPLLMFTDWEWDVSRRIQAGWAIVACIVFLLLFNMGFLIYSVTVDTVKQMKLIFIKRAKIKQ